MNACYKSIEEGKDNIAQFELIPWILSQCSSVDEVKLLIEKINILNENSKYKEYLTKLKTFNNTLLASSTLLEDYIDNKVSI